VDTKAFDALARRAGRAASRRAALIGLGGAALAAGRGGAPGARAGTAGKKARKRCRRQRGQCVAFLETEWCVNGSVAERAGAEGAPIDACVAFFRPCCDLLARCKAGQALSCLNERP
jgi:hypothetical protein